jgi:hypothetical protein
VVLNRESVEPLPEKPTVPVEAMPYPIEVPTTEMWVLSTINLAADTNTLRVRRIALESTAPLTSKAQRCKRTMTPNPFALVSISSRATAFAVARTVPVTASRVRRAIPERAELDTVTTGHQRGKFGRVPSTKNPTKNQTNKPKQQTKQQPTNATTGYPQRAGKATKPTATAAPDKPEHSKPGTVQQTVTIAKDTITKALTSKGITVDVPVTSTDEFIVPPALMQHLGSDMKRIPFYRPTQGHQLMPQDTYAVRLNEAYVDIGAALEWERIYVRAAMLRAEKMFFYKCSAKNPILIMHGFSAFNIRVGNDRVTDSAKTRCITVTPFTNIVKATTSITANKFRLYRATGTTEMIQHLAAKSLPENHLATKDSHMEGCATAHLYLTETQVLDVVKIAMIEDMSHIISSTKETHQVTIRKNGATRELIQLAMKLQEHGATTCLRTHGTIRATFERAVNARTLQELRVKHPTVRFYTDTPVSVWGQTRQEDQPERKPVPTGKKLMKISADYMPHPDHFQVVATHFKGIVHQIRPSKFTDRPMSCLIVVDASTPTTEWESAAHQFGPEGLWYISAVGAVDV